MTSLTLKPPLAVHLIGRPESPHTLAECTMTPAKKAKRTSFKAGAKAAGRQGAALSQPVRLRTSKPVISAPDTRAATFRKLGSVSQCVSVFPVTLRAFSLLHKFPGRHHTWLHCWDLADYNASSFCRPEPVVSFLVRAGEELRRDDLAVQFPQGLVIGASADHTGRTGKPGPLIDLTLWVKAWL